MRDLAAGGGREFRHTWIDNCFCRMRPSEYQRLHRWLHRKMHRSNLAALLARTLYQLRIHRSLGLHCL